jgi:small subunit ribosomal protein S4
MKCNRSRPHFKKAFQAKINVTGNPKLNDFSASKWNTVQKTIGNQKRTTPPLQRMSRLFEEQWRAKQNFKGLYSVPKEKQWKIVIKKVQKDHNKLIEAWESRLDTVVWRLCFAPSIYSARQLINHGHVYVNGSKVSTNSFTLKQGDLIQLKLSDVLENKLKEKLMSTNFFSKSIKEAKTNTNINKKNFPKHLEVSFVTLSGIFVEKPKFSTTPFPYNVNIARVMEMK